MNPDPLQHDGGLHGKGASDVPHISDLESGEIDGRFPDPAPLASETDTPRTDAAKTQWDTIDEAANFARTLERELTAARAELETLRNLRPTHGDVKCIEAERDAAIARADEIAMQFDQSVENFTGMAALCKHHRETAGELRARIAGLTSALDAAQLEVDGEHQHTQLYVQKLDPRLWKEYHDKGTSPAGWRCLAHNVTSTITSALDAARTALERATKDTRLLSVPHGEPEPVYLFAALATIEQVSTETEKGPVNQTCPNTDQESIHATEQVTSRAKPGFDATPAESSDPTAGSGNCPDCGQPWDAHEMGVPKPGCPAPDAGSQNDLDQR